MTHAAFACSKGPILNVSSRRWRGWYRGKMRSISRKSEEVVQETTGAGGWAGTLSYCLRLLQTRYTECVHFTLATRFCHHPMVLARASPQR